MFYAAKLQEQMDLVARDDGSPREALDLWDQLKGRIPSAFEGVEVKPSLLHGDLWSGNAAQAEGKAGEARPSKTTGLT